MIDGHRTSGCDLKALKFSLQAFPKYRTSQQHSMFPNCSGLRNLLSHCQSFFVFFFKTKDSHSNFNGCHGNPNNQLANCGFLSPNPHSFAHMWANCALELGLEWSTDMDAIYKKGRSRIYIPEKAQMLHCVQQVPSYQSMIANNIYFSDICWAVSIRIRDATFPFMNWDSPGEKKKKVFWRMYRNILDMLWQPVQLFFFLCKDNQVVPQCSGVSYNSTYKKSILTNMT